LLQGQYQNADVFLDSNSTHKFKMQDLYKELAKELTIQLNFHMLPTYSPKLNLVEYIIHLIRQKFLHHSDHNQNLAEVENNLIKHLHNKKFVSQEQIINTLQHIEDLVNKV
jgi:transposase